MPYLKPRRSFSAIYPHTLTRRSTWILILFCSLPLVSRSALASPSSSPELQRIVEPIPEDTKIRSALEYTVQGVVQERSKYMDAWIDGLRTSDFTVIVKGSQWFVKLRPWPQPEMPMQTFGGISARPVIPSFEEASSDGTNSYYVDKFRTPTGDTRGEGEVTIATVPVRATIGILNLWYAYASHLHLGQRINDMILPLSPPELLKRPVPLQKPLVLEIDPISPGLPRKIVVSYVTGAGTNRFENEARFEALAFTNVNGINLPTRVRTEYSHEVFGAKHFTVDIELKTFDPQASIESFRPLLGGDYRIINRDAPVTNSLRGAPESVSTRATNEWPSFQTFAALWNRWEMP